MLGYVNRGSWFRNFRPRGGGHSIPVAESWSAVQAAPFYWCSISRASVIVNIHFPVERVSRSRPLQSLNTAGAFRFDVGLVAWRRI
jgi:hypothetical protein